jgi:hypothetical protein
MIVNMQLELSNEIGEAVQSASGASGWSLEGLSEEEMAELERAYAALEEETHTATVPPTIPTTVRHVHEGTPGAVGEVEVDVLSAQMGELRLPDAPAAAVDLGISIQMRQPREEAIPAMMAG